MTEHHPHYGVHAFLRDEVVAFSYRTSVREAAEVYRLSKGCIWQWRRWVRDEQQRARAEASAPTLTQRSK